MPLCVRIKLHKKRVCVSVMAAAATALFNSFVHISRTFLFIYMSTFLMLIKKKKYSKTDADESKKKFLFTASGIFCFGSFDMRIYRIESQTQ